MTTRTIKGVLDEAAANGYLEPADHLALRHELDELQARAPAFDECVASGAACCYTDNGPNGEMQCKYCGKGAE